MARQADDEFGVFPNPRIDLDRSPMLLGHDVVAGRQAKPRPLAGGLGREERLEELAFDLGLDAAAIVPDAHFDGVEEIASFNRPNRLKGRVYVFPPARGGGVET